MSLEGRKQSACVLLFHSGLRLFCNDMLSKQNNMCNTDPRSVTAHPGMVVIFVFAQKICGLLPFCLFDLRMHWKSSVCVWDIYPFRIETK